MHRCLYCLIWSFVHSFHNSWECPLALALWLVISFDDIHRSWAEMSVGSVIPGDWCKVTLADVCTAHT